MWKDVRIHKGAHLYIPYFNGQILDHCFAANEEECWADVLVIGPEDHPFYVPFIDDVARIRLYGYVELKRK